MERHLLKSAPKAGLQRTRSGFLWVTPDRESGDPLDRVARDRRNRGTGRAVATPVRGGDGADRPREARADLLPVDATAPNRPFRGAFARFRAVRTEMSGIRNHSEGTSARRDEPVTFLGARVRQHGRMSRRAGALCRKQIGIRGECACSFPTKLTARLTA